MSQAPSFVGRQMWPQAAQGRDCNTTTQGWTTKVLTGIGKAILLKRAERAEVIRIGKWRGGGKERRCQGS